MRLVDAIMDVFFTKDKSKYTQDRPKDLAWCSLCYRDIKESKLTIVFYEDSLGEQQAECLCPKCLKKVQKGGRHGK